VSTEAAIANAVAMRMLRSSISLIVGAVESGVESP